MHIEVGLNQLEVDGAINTRFYIVFSYLVPAAGCDSSQNGDFHLSAGRMSGDTQKSK